MFFLSRGKPNPSPSFPSREKIIVRTINGQTISNIFSLFLTAPPLSDCSVSVERQEISQRPAMKSQAKNEGKTKKIFNVKNSEKE